MIHRWFVSNNLYTQTRLIGSIQYLSDVPEYRKNTTLSDDTSLPPPNDSEEQRPNALTYQGYTPYWAHYTRTPMKI